MNKAKRMIKARAWMSRIAQAAACLIALSLPRLAFADMTINNINAFPGSPDGWNCTGTQNSSPTPGWKWNYDLGSGPGCVNSELVGSPSLDGQSREMDMTWKCPSGSTCSKTWGGVIDHAVINSQGNGNLDTTDTSFSYSIWVYYTDLTSITALEFDLNQVLANSGSSTDSIIYAAQCDFDSGTWDIGNGWPIHSNVPCIKSGPNASPLTVLNTWHHVVLSYHRGAHTPGNDIVTYDSVAIDGTVYPFTGNNTHNDADTLNWQPPGALIVNWQMDYSFTSAGSASAWADEITVVSPENPNTGGGGGGGGNTGTIAGQVTNISNGAGIANAAISYSGGQTNSDSNGNYTLSNVSTGTYQVTASGTGYLPRTFPVIVTSGNTTTQNFPLATAGTMSGTVTNSAGAPLVNAQVSLSGGIIPSTMSVLTNATGYYSTSWIAVGTYTVTANMTGYIQQQQGATITAGQNTPLNFSLSPNNNGTIAGQVTNISNGAGIAGASVTYSGGSIISDAAGNYFLTNVSSGAYQVTATANGYLARTFPVTVVAGSTTTQNFPLAAAGTMSGTVTNSAGAPLANAQVSLSGGIIPSTMSVLTNASGNYSTSWIAVGAYTVTASLSGYQQKQQGATITAGQNTPLNFNLPYDNGTIVGQVTNISNGAGIAGASVTYSGGLIISDAAGNYVLTNVSSGTYQVTATANGYLARTSPVTVVAGSTTTQNFPLATAGTMSGTATTSAGAPLANAQVSLSGGIIPSTMSVLTNASGNYSTSWIAIGTYTVTASTTGYNQQQQGATIAAGKNTVVNFSLAPSTGSIKGQVTNVSNGAGLGGATISYSGGQTTSDSSGNYTLPNIPTGTYSVTAVATGYLARAFPVTVNSGTATIQNFPLATAGILSGTVTNSAGAPLANAQVSLSGGIIHSTMSVLTNASGNYNSGWIPVGSYTATATASGYNFLALPAAITAGQTTTLNFALPVSGGQRNVAGQAPGITASFVYPDPAIYPANPTVRVCPGVTASSVDLTIYDVSGRAVASTSDFAGPFIPSTGNGMGQECYEYVWGATKASGSYFGVVIVKSPGNPQMQARLKFAVIR